MSQSRYLEIIKKNILEKNVIDPYLILKDMLSDYSRLNAVSKLYTSGRNYVGLSKRLQEKNNLNDMFAALNELTEPLDSKDDLTKLFNAFFNVYQGPNYIGKLTKKFSSQLELSERVPFNFVTGISQNLSKLLKEAKKDHEICRSLGEVCFFLEEKDQGMLLDSLTDLLSDTNDNILEAAFFGVMRNYQYLKKDLSLKMLQAFTKILVFPIRKEYEEVLGQFISQLPDAVVVNMMKHLLVTALYHSEAKPLAFIFLSRVWPGLSNVQKNIFPATMFFNRDMFDLDQNLQEEILKNLTKEQRYQFLDTVFKTIKEKSSLGCSAFQFNMVVSSEKQYFKELLAGLDKTTLINHVELFYEYVECLEKDKKEQLFNEILDRFAPSNFGTLNSVEKLIANYDYTQLNLLAKKIISVLSDCWFDNQYFARQSCLMLVSIVKIIPDLKNPTIEMIKKIQNKNNGDDLCCHYVLGILRGLLPKESESFVTFVADYKNFKTTLHCDFSNTQIIRKIFAELWSKFTIQQQDILAKTLCQCIEEQRLTEGLYIQDLPSWFKDSLVLSLTINQKIMFLNALEKEINQLKQNRFIYKKIFQSMSGAERKIYQDSLAVKHELDVEKIALLVRDKRQCHASIDHYFSRAAMLLSLPETEKLQKKLLFRVYDRSFVINNKMCALKSMNVSLEILLTGSDVVDLWASLEFHKDYMNFYLCLVPFWKTFDPSQMRVLIKNMVMKMQDEKFAESNLPIVFKAILDVLDYPRKVSFLTMLSAELPKHFNISIKIDLFRETYQEVLVDRSLDEYLPPVLSATVKAYI